MSDTSIRPTHPWERFDDEAAFKQHFDETHTKDYVALDLTEVVQYFVSDVLG
ncbi:Uncharacterised protein [Kingella potus]|uniref:Uncharacterized protein n=1 Tax=Kingella potus TaxID=265175 RepID=A0A377R250_9NEIS|nr:hypothetical protein [Kingella potus]UOP01307.1 hypothetical protein LVJ84_03385 [Kingella potus]STR00381.1 Uncharacterised protein [Kingella potus]